MGVKKSEKYFETEGEVIEENIERSDDAVVVIPQEEYNKYQQIETDLEKEKSNAKVWQEKYMEQVAQNKKLQEEKKENGQSNEEKKRFEQLMQEAQGIYDESQKLEKGIIKFIKSLA